MHRPLRKKVSPCWNDYIKSEEMDDLPFHIGVDDDWKYKLIEQVKLFPCLYSRKKKTAAERQFSWIEISLAMNSTVLWCKKKWLKLRDQYSRQVKATRDSHGIYKSTWKFYESMSFVEPHVVTMGITEVEKFLNNTVEVLPQVIKRKPGRPRKIQRDFTFNGQNHVQKLKKGTKKPAMLKSRRSTRICYMPPPPILDESSEVLKVATSYSTPHADKVLATSTTKETHAAPVKDPCAIPVPTPVAYNEHDEEFFFGMNIACKLRQMTPRNKALAQAEIREKLLQIEYGVPYQAVPYQAELQ